MLFEHRVQTRQTILKNYEICIFDCGYDPTLKKASWTIDSNLIYNRDLDGVWIMELVFVNPTASIFLTEYKTACLKLV